MKQEGKRAKKIIRDLSRKAYSRQQRAHLDAIAEKVDAWRQRSISDDDLAGFLWDHFSGPAKQLRDRHAYLDSEALLAGAVADEVIQERELPDEIREAILTKARALAQIARGRLYLFRITLKGIEPPIWREVLVPDHYTFWDLHVAIQDAMAWRDYHLHEFLARDPSRGDIDRIGIPDPEGLLDDEPMHPSWRVPIAKYFTLNNSVADYLYDFGDGWQHSVILEDIRPRDAGVTSPSCIAGERACPPEDVGGIPGYEAFVASIADPSDPEHDRNLEWVGGSYDPDAFDPAAVRFDDPQERWNHAFLDADEPDA